MPASALYRVIGMRCVPLDNQAIARLADILGIDEFAPKSALHARLGRVRLAEQPVVSLVVSHQWRSGILVAYLQIPSYPTTIVHVFLAVMLIQVLFFTQYLAVE